MRLLHILAAVVVLAIGAQGMALAQTAKVVPPEKAKKVDARRAQRKGQKAGNQKQITRSIAGQTVAIDPSTGRLQQPTPQEAQNLAAGLQEILSQSAEGLEIVQHPNGMMSVDLEDRFQDVAVAKVNPDGSVALGCVSDPKSAEAFLKSGSAKKPVQTSAKSAAGKE
jgi:hypothetical protein